MISMDSRFYNIRFEQNNLTEKKIFQDFWRRTYLQDSPQLQHRIVLRFEYIFIIIG